MVAKSRKASPIQIVRECEKRKNFRVFLHSHEWRNFPSPHPDVNKHRTALYGTPRFSARATESGLVHFFIGSRHLSSDWVVRYKATQFAVAATLRPITAHYVQMKRGQLRSGL